MPHHLRQQPPLLLLLLQPLAQSPLQHPHQHLLQLAALLLAHQQQPHHLQLHQHLYRLHLLLPAAASCVGSRRDTSAP